MIKVKVPTTRGLQNGIVLSVFGSVVAVCPSKSGYPSAEEPLSFGFW